MTDADNGKTIEIRRGEQLSIRLSENPTTGYRWSLDKSTPDLLALAGDQYNQASSTGVGGGGQRAFTFNALKAGVAHLELKQWREWEGDRSVIKRFTLTVQVR